MKTVLRYMIALSAACVLSAAFSMGADAPDGAALFKSKCSMCHGPDGKGYAAVKTPDFTSPTWQSSMTDKQIAEVVKNGKPNTMMMPFGSQLSDADIQALVKQIRSFDSSKKK